MRIVNKGHLGVFEDLNSQFPAHGRKVLEEDLERVACFQVLEDDSHWYPCTDENRCSTEDFGV